MRRYYDSLETMLCNVQLLKGWSPSLCTRLNRGQKPLFADPHMRYRREPGIKCTGPTFVDMLDHSKLCRQLIDEARVLPLPERIKSRLAEDERIFAYAERTLRYYDECVRAYQLAWADRKEEARRHYESARREAELLRQDAWPVSPEYTYHEEPLEGNALTASNAAGALDHLAKLLKPSRQKKQAKRPD